MKRKTKPKKKTVYNDNVYSSPRKNQKSGRGSGLLKPRKLPKK